VIFDDKRARDIIVRARVQLLLKQPFFGVLATYLEPKPRELGPFSGGMATDGRFLYYDPDKIANIPESQIEGIVAHEVLHNALLHLYRRGPRDPFRWNMATDFAVNLIVKESFDLPGDVLYDKAYEGKPAEEIYNLLPGPRCPKCKSSLIKGVKYTSTKIGEDAYKVEAEYKCQSCGHEWSDTFTRKPGEFGEGFPMPFDQIEGDFPSTLDDHSVWEEKETEAGEAGETREKAEKLAQEWKGRAIRAAHVAKMQGRVPAGLERFIDDLLYPKLSWRELLWQYTTSLSGSELDWRRPNRKLLQYGIYYPTKKGRELNIAVAVDTSGSISDDELKEFLSELKGILSTFENFRIRLFACDADIHTSVLAMSPEDFEQFKVKIKGGGGTSFIPVFKALENELPEALIYLTDAYGDYPKHAPGYDVIWVISKEGDPKRPPFGRVLELK
jgi:predicted metal-dependent peptidase